MQLARVATGLVLAAASAAAAGPPGERGVVVNAIVAIVNGEAITKLEVDSLVAELYRDSAGLTPDQYRETWEKARETLIDTRLLIQEARRRHIEVPPDEVNAEVQRLAKAGIKAENRRDMIRENLMLARLLGSLQSLRAITPKEVADYYEKHRDDFLLREQRQVQLIMVRAEDFGGDRDAARRQAEEIVARLKKGEDFAVLARRFSKGPGANKGGDQGWLKRGSLIPKLDDVVFGLKVGEFSKPVAAGDSFVIVRVAAVRPASLQSLAEARPAIERQLRAEERRRRRNRLVERLRRKASILRFDFAPNGTLKPAAAHRPGGR